MTENMIGEERLLQYFKSERDRLLANFATGETPPDFKEVQALAIYQTAIQAVEALIRDGGFKSVEGEKPPSPFWTSSSEPDVNAMIG